MSSFGITTSSMISDINLMASEGEEIAQEGDGTMSEESGELKTETRQYTLSLKPETGKAKEMREHILNFVASRGCHTPSQSEKTSFMDMVTKTMLPRPAPSKNEKKGETSDVSSQKGLGGKFDSTSNKQHLAKQEPGSKTPATLKERDEIARAATKSTPQEVRRETLKEKGRQEPLPLCNRRWAREESKKWWETRYHQRDKDGGQREGRQQHDDSEKEEKKLAISKSSGINAKTPATPDLQKQESPKIKKPELDPPKMGVFALYYILTKMGILSDGVSNFAYKKEIEELDLETNETHKKRLDEVREAVKKEKENARWEIAHQIFSWIGSLTGIFAGIALVATGIGAVGGALMIAGGAMQLANQVMSLTGGWKKIGDLLPGDDSEKKRAVLCWMQIGVTVISLILAGTAFVWNGISQTYQMFQSVMNGYAGAFSSIGMGVTSIGNGITTFMYGKRTAAVKQFDIRLEQLKSLRREALEKVEWGVDRLEQLFEDLAHALEFEVELFRADQMILR